MSSLTATRPFGKVLAVGVGSLLGGLALLVGGWLLWSVLRPPPDGFPPTTGQALSVAGRPLGVYQHTVDARSRQDWVEFDFSLGRAVSTPHENLDWDLAFRRTDVLTNSGDANPEGLGGAIDLGKIPLEEAIAPIGGYVTDVVHDERGLENPTLHNWYNYNWTTHIVTSKKQTYALRTATGEVVLLAFVSYYCDDGSSGCITFQYLYPDGPQSSSGRLSMGD